MNSVAVSGIVIDCIYPRDGFVHFTIQNTIKHDNYGDVDFDIPIKIDDDFNDSKNINLGDKVVVIGHLEELCVNACSVEVVCGS